MTPPPTDLIFADGLESGNFSARDSHMSHQNLTVSTDTDNAYLIPGFSDHEELQLLVEAGLSPYEALRAGTRDAADALGKLDQFGTVTEGKRADLILVEGNPLEDVAHANKRAGVMLRGYWLPETQLLGPNQWIPCLLCKDLLERTLFGSGLSGLGMLDELVESYSPTRVSRVSP